MKKKLVATIVAGVISLGTLSAFAACGGENTKPEIKGVKESITVESNTQFDALEGVTAIDKEDGDLTKKIVVTSIPELSFTDGKATPPRAGTYELTYTVTDSGKLTTEAYSTLTATRHAAAPTSLVKFDFSDKAAEAHGWTPTIDSAVGTAALKEGAYVFDVTNLGDTDDGGVLLSKTMTLAAADYKIKVWAKSTKDTYIHVIAKDADETEWTTPGGKWNAKVDTTMKAVETDVFTLNAEKNIELRIHMGKITPNSENQADTTPNEFTLTIEKIELYKITGTETQNALKTYNFASDINGVTTAADDALNVAATHESGVAKITIGSYPTETNDDWRIKATLALPSVTIEKNKKYYYSFKATAQNAVGDLIVCAEDNTTEWQNRACYHSYSLVAGEEKTISGTFTYDKDITDSVLRLYLGKHAAGVTDNVITIDDVVFGEVMGDKKTEKTLDRFIAFGKGSQEATNPVYIWDTFNGTDEDQEKGVGTIWTEGGSLFYRIEEGAKIDWHNKLFFGYTGNPLTLPADSYFTIKFTAKASKAVSCPMFLSLLEKWDSRVNQKIDFTTEYKEFTFTTTETLVAAMDFALLFQFGSATLADLGEVTIEFKDFEILQSVVS